jgi:hypothetical protein
MHKINKYKSKLNKKDISLHEQVIYYGKLAHYTGQLANGQIGGTNGNQSTMTTTPPVPATTSTIPVPSTTTISTVLAPTTESTIPATTWEQLASRYRFDSNTISLLSMSFRALDFSLPIITYVITFPSILAEKVRRVNHAEVMLATNNMNFKGPIITELATSFDELWERYPMLRLHEKLKPIFDEFPYDVVMDTPDGRPPKPVQEIINFLPSAMKLHISQAIDAENQFKKYFKYAKQWTPANTSEQWFTDRGLSDMLKIQPITYDSSKPLLPQLESYHKSTTGKISSVDSTKLMTLINVDKVLLPVFYVNLKL